MSVVREGRAVQRVASRGMRILFTFAGGTGHLEPLVPIARAAQRAGHTVAFAGRPWMIPQVEALGITGFATGSDVGLTPKRLPLVAVDVERDMRAVADGFVRRIARERAAALLPLCADWQPDLLVCEELDFGPMLVAERLEIPHASVLVIASGSFVRAQIIVGPLNELRAEHGLAPDPELVMLRCHLVLSPGPPSLRDPGFPLPDTAHSVRVSARDAARGGGEPTVWFMLGTIYNMESGDLFQRVIEGVRELPLQLVVSVGRDFDPAELGTQPANVRIERYVAQAERLPRCELVISHGGSGSVLNALAHGVPMLLLPLGADQPLNAARCEALGVARVLDAATTTPKLAREAVSRVLESPTYRRAAERLRDENAALPGPEHAVMLLERLMGFASLVPELYVSELSRSLHFYVDLLGFAVEYARPEVRFASLALGGARIMLEETRSLEASSAAELARGEFRTAELRAPFGRGVNLELRVPDVAAVSQRLSAAGYPPLLDTYEKSYRVGTETLTVRQLLVADPDGYLIRPSQVLEPAKR